MDTDLLNKKLQFYSDSQKAVHLNLSDGKFRNGFIKYIGADFVLLQENRLGEMCVFFIEIEDINPYFEEGKP